MAQRSLSRVQRRLPDADDHPNYVSFIHISVLTFQQVFVDGYSCAAWLEQLIIIIIKTKNNNNNNNNRKIYNAHM